MEKTFRHFCLKVQVDPELRKAFKKLKTKPVKSDTISQAKKLKFYDSSAFETIYLPKQEYAHVMSEIASNITEEQQKQKVLTKPIGDYFYTFENNGFGEYRIIGKKPIDEEALEWWDE